MHRGPTHDTMVNPITLKVVRHAIFSITEEMRLILMRSARRQFSKKLATSPVC